jgi:dolichol-phosphate mannosyltransferase
MVLSFGVQLIFIGIMGLYIARIFLEVKRRPHHFVRRSVGFTPIPVDRDRRIADRVNG